MKPVAWISESEFSHADTGGEHMLVKVRQAENYTIPLYTHPAQELNDGGEPVKNATYWKRQCNLLQSSLTNLQSSLYHANEQIKYLESHPAKTLTDEEIEKIEHKVYLSTIAKGKPLGSYSKALVQAILRKAQEK